MARKQARRRKTTPRRKFEWPKIRLGRLAVPLAAVAIVAATYEICLGMLDTEIESLEISGPFQRVSALQIEEAVADELDKGFIGADLGTIQRRLREMSWIDQAAVARRWPDRIAITVTEQVPAAVWDERGLLNVRGELFVEQAQHLPAELPRLAGPAGQFAAVAKRYLEVRERLIPVGLDVRTVELDARGAWNLKLTNGVDVRLGRRDTDLRADLFIDVVADVIAGRAADIDYVDMRYSNGFTVGWKDGASAPADEPVSDEPSMLASRGDQ